MRPNFPFLLLNIETLPSRRQKQLHFGTIAYNKLIHPYSFSPQLAFYPLWHSDGKRGRLGLSRSRPSANHRHLNRCWRKTIALRQVHNTNKLLFTDKLVYTRRIGEEKEENQYLFGFFWGISGSLIFDWGNIYVFKMFVKKKKIFLYIIIKETTQEYEKRQYIYIWKYEVNQQSIVLFSSLQGSVSIFN